MLGQLNIKYANILRQQFEFRCLNLIIQAYQAAYISKTVTPIFDEEDITEVLNNFLDDNPQRIEWQIATNTENRLRNDKITKVKGFSKQAARIDLRFTTMTSSMEYRYYMEAKNLKIKSSALKRRYIKTGIDNYISTKYNDGFLVGYVLQGNISNNIDGVNKLLIKDSRGAEIITLSPTKIGSFDQFVSTHPTLRIKHMFFDFT
jgi:hypothetical protein